MSKTSTPKVSQAARDLLADISRPFAERSFAKRVTFAQFSAACDELIAARLAKYSSTGYLIAVKGGAS